VSLQKAPGNSQIVGIHYFCDVSHYRSYKNSLLKYEIGCQSDRAKQGFTAPVDAVNRTTASQFMTEKINKVNRL
jgi:hypothetical protein